MRLNIGFDGIYHSDTGIRVPFGSDLLNMIKNHEITLPARLDIAFKITGNIIYHKSITVTDVTPTECECGAFHNYNISFIRKSKEYLIKDMY